MNKTLVYGTDPELFSAYEKNGKLFVLPPVFMRKDLGIDFEHHPKHPKLLKRKNYFLHEDGVAVEISLKPSTSWEELYNTVQESIRDFEETVLRQFPEYCLPTLFNLPTINYEVNRWINAGNEYLMCTVFGCDPDDDAFEMKKRHKILNVEEHPFRYGGGHIHFSGRKSLIDEPILAIKSLAMTVGNAAIAFSPVPELEKERTFLYGRPGKFRIQVYPKRFNNIEFSEQGIEYRTPSNSWTKNFELTSKIFSWAEIGIFEMLEKELYKTMMTKEFLNNTVSAILNADQELAKENLNLISQHI